MQRRKRRGRRFRTQFGVATVALTAVAFAACTSMGSMEPPAVTLAGVEPTEVTMFETTVQVKLRVSNPNPEPMTLEGASFKLRLEGQKIGQGLSSETVIIDRLGSTLLDVTFHVNNAVALLQLKEILDQEAMDYGIRAVLYTRGSWGTKKLKVEKEGRFDFTTAMEATPGS